MALVAVALIAGGLRAAEGANSASFSDPLGDYRGGSPDIVSGSIANDDAGQITVRVNFAEGRPFESGMQAGVFFDSDGNPSTGDTGLVGSEYWLLLTLSGGSGTWAYYAWNGSAWVAAPSAATVSVSFNSTAAQFSVNRSEVGGTSSPRFWVFGYWGANSGTDFDFAPDTGSYPFSVVVPSATTSTTTPTPTPTTGGGGGGGTTTAPVVSPPPTTPDTGGVKPASVTDTDGDGLKDDADKCPKTRGGAYDYNKNGCAGPFARIPLPALKDISPRLTLNEVTWWDPMHPAMVRGLPAGANVQLKAPGGSVVLIDGKPRRIKPRTVIERARTTSTGVFRSNVLTRGRFLKGDVAELRIWKPGWIGYSVQLVIKTRAPLLVFGSRRCIPPTSTAPRPCSRVGRGS